MVGMVGFEPTHNGVKVRCLTTWRHPNKEDFLLNSAGVLYKNIAKVKINFDYFNTLINMLHINLLIKEKLMLKLIQFVQKRPSDMTIRLTGVIFGLIIIIAGYYNLIYQGNALNETIFRQNITQDTAQYIAYGIIALGFFPLIKSIVNKCILPKKYMKYLQLFFALILFTASSLIQESSTLDFDTLLGFMWVIPLFSGITGKMITCNCLKYWEKVTKIRV